MKKFILINLLVIGGITSNNVIAQTNNKANDKANNFKVHLTMIYEHYINLKSAFIASDAKMVITKAKALQEELVNVNTASQYITNNKEWKLQSSTIAKTLKAMIGTQDIKLQRVNFASLSLALYKSIKTYGVLGMKTYYQYCPKANNGKGAYWLSLKEKISNPYFGEKMPTCGKTTEIITSTY